jgi:hypothetical protein
VLWLLALLVLLVVAVLLDPAVVAGDDEVLQVVVEEGALDVLDVLVLTAAEDLVFQLGARRLILLGLSFLVADVQGSDVALLVP